MITVGIMSAFMNNIGAAAILLPAVITISERIETPPFYSKYGLNVIHIVRESQPAFFPGADRPIKADDIMLVEGQPRDILKASEALDLVPLPDSDAQELETELTAGSERLVEVTLSPRSDLEGKTLKDIDFQARFDLVVLAIRHEGQSLVSRLTEIPLNFGDALLVQGEAERIERLRMDNKILILDTPPIKAPRRKKAPLTLFILLGALGIIITGWLSPAAVLLIAALLMILTGILRMDEAYEAIDWRSIFLIAGILPLGIAMETSGTAVLIADQIVALLGDLGPRGVMLGLFILTALLTEVISNAAATVLLVPIAIDIALGLNVSPKTYVMAVVLAASTSFLMPIGQQVNVIIFGPGGYRFADYPKVGIWLNLIILILVAIFLPIVWPF